MLSASKTAAPSTGGYTISRSVRLRASASAYLNKTFTTPTNNKIFTFSLWIKRGALGSTYSYPNILGTSADEMLFYSATYIDEFAINMNAGASCNIVTSQVFRDPSAWYHIVVAVDTTQSTASNRVKIYVNGVQITSFATASYPSLNYTPSFNSAVAHNLGGNSSSSRYFDGYMTEVNFIDGQALTPTSFGAYNSTTGVWQPIKYSGTYGTNGFYLNFSNNASTTTLGYDTSGNGNNWTTNNISLTSGATYDSMTDVPTLTSSTASNYCVLNPIALNPSNPASTCSDGNLTASASASNTMRKATMSITSGANYFEATVGSTVQGFGLGEAAVDSFGSSSSTVGARTYYLYNTGSLYTILPGGATSITTTVGSGGTLAVAVDMTNKKLWLGYAASGGGSITWIGGGSPSAGTTPTYTLTNETELFPLALTNGPSLYCNFGQRPFTYTPPTGFVALNTYNLPTPTIKNGATAFAATTFTGNGTSQSISNAGNNTLGITFQPDFVWGKNRTSAYSNVLVDVIRGATNYLVSNATAAEATNAQVYSAFTSTGFSVGNDLTLNANASSVVAWQWKAGGTGSSNTNGSITSTVSVNATAGFSIVTYTGTGANATVGHGLGVAPQMVIVKSRSFASSWPIYHSGLTSSAYAIYLDLTNAQANQPTVWNSTPPTSTVFNIGSAAGVNQSSSTFVAYCFAAVKGYSAFGSYTGNGSTDGPFVYLGFRPRWVMVKRTDSTSDWYIWDTSRDTYNVESATLLADTSGAETSATSIDDLSNGFKCRSSTVVNASGGTYIYAVFAEAPFNYSLAR